MGIETPPNMEGADKVEHVMMGTETIRVVKKSGSDPSDPAVMKAKQEADEWVKTHFKERSELPEQSTEELEDLPEGKTIPGLVALGDRLIDPKTRKQYRIPKI